MSNVELNAVDSLSDFTLNKVTIQSLSDPAEEMGFADPDAEDWTITCDSKNSCCC